MSDRKVYRVFGREQNYIPIPLQCLGCALKMVMQSNIPLPHVCASCKGELELSHTSSLAEQGTVENDEFIINMTCGDCKGEFPKDIDGSAGSLVFYKNRGFYRCPHCQSFNLSSL